jgi:hypothetical protein
MIALSEIRIHFPRRLNSQSFLPLFLQRDLSQTMSPPKRVAVLYQALEPPIINGIQKPKKPGGYSFLLLQSRTLLTCAPGYRDSSADIAFVLQLQRGIEVITPAENPDPHAESDWCFPDCEQGILEAVKKGATYLWANTILFSKHPLQVSTVLTEKEKNLRIVGQPPLFVELYDDKNAVNEWLRQQEGLTLPRAFTIQDEIHDLPGLTSSKQMSFPLVAKPVRGRGSHGVKVCASLEELYAHIESLLAESPLVLIEEYLAGEEITITVIPPSDDKSDFWALPIVTRFNHHGGIAPYNGVVAVTQNSRVVSQDEFNANVTYEAAAQECVTVAKLLKCTAPMRIDMRRYDDEAHRKFALFDVNVKPAC